MTGRPLQFALCPSVRARGWSQESSSWEDLVRLLTVHDLREEKDGPLWSPVSVLETAQRKNESVEAVHLLVLDFDCGKSLEDVLPPLAGWEMVVHTSHSHAPEHPKFRIVVPLIEPVPADRWKSWWTAFVADRAPDCDLACKNSARIYFLPSCPEEMFLEAQALHIPGAWLDPSPWLREELELPTNPTPERTGSAKPTGRGDYSTLDVRTWLKQVSGLNPQEESGGEGKLFIVCPWKNEHTGGAQGPQDTYVLNKHDGGKPVFKCSHSHCRGRGFWDLLSVVGDADRFCHGTFEPAPRDHGNGPGLEGATPEQVDQAIQSIATGIEWDPVDGHGNPKCGVSNALRFLRASFKDHAVRFNQLTRLLEVDGQVIDEVAMAKQRERLEIVSGQTKWAQLHLDQATQILATEVPNYHPVREYLESLTWDGTDRLSSLIFDVFNVTNPLAIQQRYIETWFISAVARALKPGCKVDTALILQGPQGARKSSFFRYLVPVEAWFSDDMGTLETKDSQMAVGRCWLIEWAELESMRRSNVGAVKAFLTRQVDSFRPPYGRSFVDIPRASVIVGSTNEDQFLHDTTGSRRYMVIPVQHVDTDRVAADRDQLWAEAVYRFKNGEPWFLSTDEMAVQAVVNAELTSEDPWESVLQRWLVDGASWTTAVGYYTTLGDIFSGCLEIPIERRTRLHQMRVAQVLASLGWKRQQMRREDARFWGYAAPQGFRNQL